MDENLDIQNSLLLPVEHLQNLLDKLESGVEVAMSSLEKMEVKKYVKLMEAQLFDDDDEDGADVSLSQEEEERRKEILRQKIEAEKRKARTKDVAYIKLTKEQMEQLKKDMSTAYVRADPRSIYNKTDDQLYRNKEEKALSDKLNKIRNCYYDAEEWRAVVDLIMKGIEYELHGDKFAYLGPYETRLKAFKEGKIKMKVKLPKLYLNRISPETDPEVLCGIYNGDITVVDKKQTEGIHHNSYKNSKIVTMDIPSICDQEHQYYLNMHRRGYMTPLSGAIKAKSTIYNRFVETKNTNKAFGIVDKNGVPIEYDWLKLGAQEYYRLLHKITPNMDSIVDNLQKANGGKLNKVLSERLNLVTHINPNGYSTERVEPNWLSASVQVKPEVIKLEQELLNAIQVTNP